MEHVLGVEVDQAEAQDDEEDTLQDGQEQPDDPQQDQQEAADVADDAKPGRMVWASASHAKRAFHPHPTQDSQLVVLIPSLSLPRGLVDEALPTTLPTTLPWALLIALVGEVLGFVFVARVLRRGGNPAVTLNWVLVILAAPYVGMLFYYLLPHRLYRRRLRRRAERVAWIEPSLPGAEWPSVGVPTGDELSRLLTRFDPEAVHPGGRLRLLATGEDLLEAARTAIASAKQFVHLQTYIFRPDAAGRRVLEMLAAAAARGIEVRLLYDSFGSWSLGGGDLASFHAAGGKSAAFLPLLWRRRPFTLNFRNHRKLLVVDGEVAILGGRNVAIEYVTDRIEGTALPWLDVMVEVRGPAVARLHRVFVEDWYHAAEEDLSDARYFPPQAASESAALVGVVDTGPDVPTELPLVLLQLIGCAREHLELSTPYLIPSPLVLAALQLAALRGVRVRIHTNGRAVENWLLYRAQRGHYGLLAQAGVEVFESREAYNHAKLILVDDRYAFVGSPNLDWRSSALNFELAITSTDPTLIAAARALFEERLAAADPVPAALPPIRLLDALCRLASPLL